MWWGIKDLLLSFKKMSRLEHYTLWATKTYPKNQKKPLALTVEITKSGFLLSTGVPSKRIKNIRKTKEGDYDLVTLHDFLVNLKKTNLKEETIVLEPIVDLTYEEIVKIMDEVRLLKKTDDSLFVKDKDGGITLYIQNESPGKALENNWLPAPKGPFVTIMRLYWAKEAALDGSWKRPPLTIVKK